ncbi:MAG: diacylglycerol kinase family protein [Planctomycetaceae bacterium]|jgi:diacylglycerol kinase|nr:diacylglycerol kinase family protein [Planctomycetaceae bacterium]
MTDRPKRSWFAKFADAFLGMRLAFLGQSSFRVHFVAAGLVVLFGLLLNSFDIVRWCILILCIGIVIGGETLNTSIEALAKAVTAEHNLHVKHSLDIASGAVLVLSVTAAVVGLILFGEAIMNYGRF